LRQRYSNNQRVRVFYQVWQQPLMTFSSRHVVDQVIRLCGGENIFAALPGLTPQVSTEAVIASDPDVIIAADFDDGSRVHDFWQRWRQLRAVRNGHVYVIHPDILHRSTPRILQGAAQLCDYLESVRSTQP
jgi:iron complex transport system substrate-binding protein